LIGALGALGDDHAIQEGARDLLAFVERDGGAEAAPVDPSVLAASITVVASSGDATDFEAFHQRFTKAATPQEELRYLYALADFRQPELADRLLAMCVTDEIRTQNAPYLLARAMGNRDQGARAWAFVRDNWDDLNERFPSNSIVRMLSGIRTLSEPEVAQDVYAFFEQHEVPQGDKQLAQHLERLEVNVALRVRDGEALSHHLTH
ncbi:MAG: ERAP1-like C-terminal domain-containing protein, partial [Acidimicrobiales bacterium]